MEYKADTQNATSIRFFSCCLNRLDLNLGRDSNAYDGKNNTFNLAYEFLSWKVHRALIKAKLEPYLGFLHLVQYGKPSIVCDFMELYRYLIDDFILDFFQGLRAKDFVVKSEATNRKKRGNREYLCNRLTRIFLNGLEGLFDSRVIFHELRLGISRVSRLWLMKRLCCLRSV